MEEIHHRVMLVVLALHRPLLDHPLQGAVVVLVDPTQEVQQCTQVVQEGVAMGYITLLEPHLMELQIPEVEPEQEQGLMVV